MKFKLIRSEDSSKTEISLEELKLLLLDKTLVKVINKLKLEIEILKEDKLVLTRDLILEKLSTDVGISLPNLNIRANPNIEKDSSIKEGGIYYNPKTGEIRKKTLNSWVTLK